MDNERREFLREKINNNDPEYVKWGQDQDGNPIKWVRTSVDGDWVLYKENDFLPVTKRVSNAFLSVIGFIFIAILIYAILKGDITLF